jgi:hypothetical protein
LAHVVVFWQDKPENTLKAFLPADVDKQLQKASSKPLSLEAISEFLWQTLPRARRVASPTAPRR